MISFDKWSDLDLKPGQKLIFTSGYGAGDFGPAANRGWQVEGALVRKTESGASIRVTRIISRGTESSPPKVGEIVARQCLFISLPTPTQ